VNGTDIISGDMLIRNVYESKKDEDGFLYMNYSEQEVLG
jgi:hypothetical protein